MQTIYSVIDFLLPFEFLNPVFMKNAFLAVLLSAPLFGALGTLVVSNNMAFFSDAIGHSALAGIAIGVLAGIPNPLFAMISFSIVLGFLIITVRKKTGASSDTIIGVFSSTASALGIVLLSVGGNFSKYSKYLIGDILSIDSTELIVLLCTDFAFFAFFLLFYNVLLLTSLHSSFAKSRGIPVFKIELIFALVTAVIVTVSIRRTGLLVVNSLLVLPAASARLLAKSSRMYVFFSLIFSLFASAAGLVIAYYAGTAAGAAIVLVNAFVFALCFLCSFFLRGAVQKK